MYVNTVTGKLIIIREKLLLEKQIVLPSVIVSVIQTEGGLCLILFLSKRRVLYNTGTTDLPARVSLGSKYRLIFLHFESQRRYH